MRSRAGDSAGQLGRVLGLAVPEGPILLLHLDEVDDHVLATVTQTLMETVDNRFVEGALHVDGPPFVHGHLDDQRICSALNAQIRWIDHESTLGMLRDDLKAIIFRGLENAYNGVVDDFSSDAEKDSKQTNRQDNARQWHSNPLQLGGVSI